MKTGLWQDAAHVLHADAVVLPSWPPFAQRREEIPSQAIAYVVSCPAGPETTEVADGAGRGREVLDG